MAKAPGNQRRQPSPANNGSKNAPLKGKEILSLLKNQKMERTMQDLLVTLKKNDAENLEINAFLDSLTYRIEKGESVGLLKLLSAQKTNKQETQINFGEIQSESCSLEELKVLDLTSFPSLSEQDPLKLGVEKAVVAYIKAEFSKGLKGEIGKKFSNFVRYNHTSLSELLNALEYFPDELNNLDQKSAFCAFRDAFRMSFFQLKEQLANGSTAISLDELNTKTFDQWTESQKVVFDTMFTKLFLNREKGRLTQLNQLTQEVGQVFSKPLPLASLCSKYPCSYEGLQERAKINRPDVLEALADCEQRRAAGEESAEAEIEQHYRTLYLETIKEQDSRLAVALTFLYEHDFDFAALEQEKALKADFFRSLAESRLEQMENAGALELFAPQQEAFKQFFLELWNSDKEEFEINGLRLSIKKAFRPGTHLELKSLSEFSAFGALPLDFSITVMNSDELNLDAMQAVNQLFGQDRIDREIKLSDNEIGKVIALFMAMQPALLQQHDPQSEEAKKLGNFFSTADENSKIDKLKKGLHQEGNESEENPELEESPEDRKKQFLEAWKSVRGENSDDQDGGCAAGAVLYCSRVVSLLPPHNDSHEWMKLEISDVNREKETISFRPKGTELKLGDQWENKSLTFSLEDFKNRFLVNDELLDKPFKLLRREDTFEKTLKNMQAYGLCDEKVLGDAQLENGKLMLKELNNNGEEVNEEVKYFGSGLGESDSNKVLYEVKWKDNGTVKVSSEGFLDKKGEVKTYEQTMSYPDFLLFLNEKKLIPKTEKIAEREKQTIKDITSKTVPGGLKWMSIHSLISSVKNIWKKINEKLDAYQKDQDQACLDWLTQDVGIYKKLENALGWLAPSLKDSFSKLHDDEISRLEKDTWKGIEEWVTIFSGIEFPDVFESGLDPASGARLSKLDNALGKRGTLKNILTSRHCVINDSTLRPIMAAAMIANLKQGKGLYRGMSEYDNQALWVQCLLGPEHYQRYLEYRKKIQADIDSGAGDADQLRDLLVKSEVNYIVWNIQNAHGKDKYFGSVSDENRQALKKIYSNEFANQLNSAAEETTGHGAVEGAYGKYKKMNTFNVVEEEFKKCIASSRIESGLGALKRMGELAKTKQQRQTLEAAMSYVTMTGILNKYAGKETMTWFDGLARSLMLPTAFFADKPFHQHYAWHVLDQVPIQPRFSESKEMKDANLTEGTFSKNSASVPYKPFLGALLKWREKNADVIDSYFLSLKTKDHKNDPILNKVKDVLWEKNPDNLDPSWRSKPKITGHHALNQTPAVLEQNKSYNKSGFEGKDEDERNEKAAFRDSLLKELQRIATDPDVKPDFFLKQFKTWFARDGFSDANDTENISMIRTIAEVKRNLGKKKLEFHDGERNITIPTSEAYSEKDVKNLIWYLFEGKILKQGSCQPPLEFKKVLDFFVNYFTTHFDEISSDKVLSKIFDKGSLEADESRAEKFVPRGEYMRYIGKDDGFFNAQEEDFDPDTSNALTPEQQRKRIKAWKKRYYRSDMFINRALVDMEKHLKRINAAPPKLIGANARGITVL